MVGLKSTFLISYSNVLFLFAMFNADFTRLQSRQFCWTVIQKLEQTVQSSLFSTRVQFFALERLKSASFSRSTIESSFLVY